MKVVTAGKEKKNLLAPDTRRVEAGAAAESLAQERAESRQPVPQRAKSYTVHRIVGKAKRGKKVKVFWKDTDTGELCAKDQCTWELPSAFDGDAGNVDAKQLAESGSTIRIQEQSSVYVATIEASSNSDSIVTVTYTARADGATCRKRPRKVDLELTPLEAASWWTEDGYDTAKEEDPAEEEDPGALGEDGEDEESESSEEGAEVSAPQRRRFSGLGRAPRRGLALP